MTRNDAIDCILAAFAPSEDRKLEQLLFAQRLVIALDALGLLPQAASAQQNQSHEMPLNPSRGDEVPDDGKPHNPQQQTHHRVDPNTVSAPHPTTTTGQSAGTTSLVNQSWQRLAAEYPPDHPAPGDLGSVPL